MGGSLRRLPPGIQRGRASVHDPQSDTAGLIPVTCWALALCQRGYQRGVGVPCRHRPEEMTDSLPPSRPISGAAATVRCGANPETADLELSFRSAPLTDLLAGTVKPLSSTQSRPF